jgi:hypothetical protein
MCTRDEPTWLHSCLTRLCGRASAKPSYRALTFIGANFHWTLQALRPHQPLAQKVHRSARLHKHALFAVTTVGYFDMVFRP